MNYKIFNDNVICNICVEDVYNLSVEELKYLYDNWIHWIKSLQQIIVLLLLPDVLLNIPSTVPDLSDNGNTCLSSKYCNILDFDDKNVLSYS